MDPLTTQNFPGSEYAALLLRMKRLTWLAAGLALCFALPLYDLFQFARHSSLYSHILLIPFISLYLAWLKRKQLPAEFQPARLTALALAIPGVLGVAVYQLGGWTPGGHDHLSLLTLCFLLLLSAGCVWLLGNKTLRPIVFPLALLIFMVPLPSFLEHLVESFLQHASAETAYLLLKLSNTPVFREGTLLVLPGIRLEVAPECSGMHSTLVLFITALLAGDMLLLRCRTKAALVASVVLIGILRNAARIFTLAQLCIHGNPGILDSDLHHRGGPLFFAASLIPCFLLLWFLRKLDLRANSSAISNQRK